MVNTDFNRLNYNHWPFFSTKLQLSRKTKSRFTSLLLFPTLSCYQLVPKKELMENLTLELSQELKTQIITAIEKETYDWFWDQNEHFNEDQIKALAERGIKALHEIEDELNELNLDNTLKAKIEYMKTFILPNFNDAIANELQTDQPEELFGDLISEYDLDAFLQEDMRIMDLAKNQNVFLNVNMYSNYDGLNSHWLESQDAQYWEGSTFGDTVDMLKLNPAKVKTILLENDEKVSGKWPNYKHRNGKELIDYEDFYDEYLNISGFAVPSFLIKIPLHTYIEHLQQRGEIKKIIVQKGTLFGFHLDGGSCFNAETKKDFMVQLDSPLKKNDPINRMNLENGYEMKNFYGFCEQAYQQAIIYR